MRQLAKQLLKGAESASSTASQGAKSLTGIPPWRRQFKAGEEKSETVSATESQKENKTYRRMYNHIDVHAGQEKSSSAAKLATQPAHPAYRRMYNHIDVHAEKKSSSAPKTGPKPTSPLREKLRERIQLAYTASQQENQPAASTCVECPEVKVDEPELESRVGTSAQVAQAAQARLDAAKQSLDPMKKTRTVPLQGDVSTSERPVGMSERVAQAAQSRLNQAKDSLELIKETRTVPLASKHGLVRSLEACEEWSSRSQAQAQKHPSVPLTHSRARGLFEAELALARPGTEIMRELEALRAVKAEELRAAKEAETALPTPGTEIMKELKALRSMKSRTSEELDSLESTCMPYMWQVEREQWGEDGQQVLYDDYQSKDECQATDEQDSSRAMEALKVTSDNNLAKKLLAYTHLAKALECDASKSTYQSKDGAKTMEALKVVADRQLTETLVAYNLSAEAAEGEALAMALSPNSKSFGKHSFKGAAPDKYAQVDEWLVANDFVQYREYLLKIAGATSDLTEMQEEDCAEFIKECGMPKLAARRFRRAVRSLGASVSE